MTGGHDPLLTHLREVLGTVQTVHHHVKRGDKQVAMVVDGEGRQWYGKLSSPPAWRREVRAYRRWVPALGDRAPRLVAVDRGRGTLILQGLPGRPATRRDAWAFEGAGALLSQYHELPLAARDTASDAVGDWIRRSRSGAQEAVAESARLGLDVPRGLVRSALDGLERWAPAKLVPTHGDFQPHNWLLTDHGVVQVVDFGDSAPRPAVYDLGQLLFRAGWDRPNLMARFLSGYGRPLTDEEHHFLRAWLGLHAIRSRLRAVHRGYAHQRRRSEAVLALLEARGALPLP